jgi:hypothetical protein
MLKIIVAKVICKSKLDIICCYRDKFLFFYRYTANEGLVKIQCKCLVPISVFPEMKLLFPKQNYNVLYPSSYTHISVKDLYISRIGLPILLQGNKGPILGIFKSLTNT